MRLLNRSLVGFSIYSVLVLLIVTPMFYWMVDGIIIETVDKELLLQKKEIQSRIQNIKSSDLTSWEDLDGDVVIELEPFNGKIIGDSIYNSTEFNSYSHQMEHYRVLVSSVYSQNEPYRLVAQISLVESEDLIKAIATTQLVVLLVLLSGLFIIHWKISKRIWGPFYSTLEGLKKFEVERAPYLQLPPTSIREFQDLNQAITQLTQRSHQVYLNQKEFTENAAHEMQTPLAVFQSKLDLLLQTNLSEEQAKVLQSLLDASSRLTKLNKALLLLSKIDNHQFIETHPFDIVDLTTRLLSFYEHEAEAKSIRIDTIIKNAFSIFFNVTLADILFSNLISNAIRHSNPKSKVAIIISGNSWEIHNEGPPLTIDSERIFDRFQKGSNDSARTGLGLAIVKKICDISGLDLAYRYENEIHIFTIVFPQSIFLKSIQRLGEINRAISPLCF